MLISFLKVYPKWGGTGVGLNQSSNRVYYELHSIYSRQIDYILFRKGSKTTRTLFQPNRAVAVRDTQLCSVEPVS